MKRRYIDLKNYPSLLTKKENTMRITLKNVRLAFPQLFEAKTVNGEGQPAFSASFIIPKNHPQIAEIKAAMREVADQKWGQKADAIYKGMEAQDKLCLHNGDLKAEYDGYAGNFFISARNKTRPLVVDVNRSIELSVADGKPYAGCYVNASIELWPQDNNYGKRINASLRGVQFFKDGDAFAGGGAASTDEFEDLSDGSDGDLV